MKKNDILCLVITALCILPIFLIPDFDSMYLKANHQHPYLLSFVKFAILATYGEILGLRIQSGKYYKQGFGLLPRALVWGILGVLIKINFEIFGDAAPALLGSFGYHVGQDILDQAFSTDKLFTAFTVSVTLNFFFAPVLMTLHAITNKHIELTGGTLKGFFSSIQVNQILSQTNWKSLWGFVIKKTIPLFWIPAQTFNFLMPEDFRVLIAALYSIILGIILAIAALKTHHEYPTV
jgi:hypothetical protein